MNNVINIAFRYFIGLVLGLGNFFILGVILTPLTVYFSFLFLNLFFDVNLSSNSLLFDNFMFNIIPACVAISAYYALVVLNLFTPMNLNKRVKSLLFLFGMLFFLNVSRIVIFIILIHEGFIYFDFIHKIVWYLGSTIMVVFLWFMNVYLFSIREIPIVSDVKFLLTLIRKNN